MNGCFRFISDVGSQRAIANLEDIRSCDVANARDQKEESVKLDRKLSFSSVLNRNSESYKQSRFRRASSFSFMPRDSCSIATNEKVLEFESNLKIRHRPRPKSLNLSQSNEVESPLDSIQCEHGPESRIEPQGRKTRLDSIVEMAAAWLEESKSVRQSQCGIAQNFDPIGEEEQAKSRRLSVNSDKGLEMKLASHGREKLPEATTELRFSNSKNAHQDTTGDSYYIRYHEESDTKSDEIARPQNSATNEVSSDRVVPVAEGLEPCVIPDGCTDDGSYLQDIRELLKGMKRKESLQKEGKNVMNANCDTQSFVPRQHMRKCEDDIDETPRNKSQNCFAAYDSPFLDDRKDREINKSEPLSCHCDEFRIEASESWEKCKADAAELNKDTTSGGGKPLIVEESSAIDGNVNEQQEIHLKTNSTDNSPGWNTSDKQTATQTLIRLSQQDVHRDAMTNITYRVAKDQISPKELKSGEEKTCDSFIEACVGRSVRPRSYSSKFDANSTTMELLHLPALRKKRTRSASNLGPQKNERDKYADLRKVLLFSGKLFNSSHCNQGRRAGGGREANCPKTTSSKRPHNTQSFEVWGAS